MKVYMVLIDFDYIENSIPSRRSINKVFKTKERAEKWTYDMRNLISSNPGTYKNANIQFKEGHLRSDYI